MKVRLTTALVLAGVAVAVSGCGSGRDTLPIGGAKPGLGAGLIEGYGCGACHTIGGISGADGEIGPSLKGFAGHRLIAGRIANTPGNLVAWIRDPQLIDPGTVMPDLGVGAAQARDIAAYLYRH
jgi:cytochrome c